MSTGIFYGTTTGKTAEVAQEIANALGVEAADIRDVGSVSADEAKAYDTLVLGSPTWGDGELQDDWQEFLDKLVSFDLSGKKIAIFGCGDSGSYPDTFCNAIGVIHEALAGKGAQLLGAYAPEGYEVTDSAVAKDGKFLGLAIDENDDAKTPKRIAAWTAQLKAELAA